jgi:AbrB family looped-hinge helix DNA binding protein
MEEHLTTVTRKGQITVPVEIRKALDLQIGDRVAVSLDEDGSLRANLRPIRSVADTTFGAIRSRRQHEKPEDSRQQFMEAAQERDERSKQRR